MAKITGILPPSAVFMFALHRPPLISGPWQRGTYLPQWASLPGTYVATMGNLERGREGGQAEDPGAPSLSCYGDSLESVP